MSWKASPHCGAGVEAKRQLAAELPPCSIRAMCRRFPLLLCFAVLVASCSRAPEKKETKPGMALAEADRVFIADVESRGLVLNRRGFPALTAAIRSADAEKVAAFFAADFAGGMFDAAEGTGVNTATLTVQRRTERWLERVIASRLQRCRTRPLKRARRQ